MGCVKRSETHHRTFPVVRSALLHAPYDWALKMDCNPGPILPRQSNLVITELFAAEIGDQIIVFKSHTTLAFDVAAGLQRNDVTCDQHIVTF